MFWGLAVLPLFYSLGDHPVYNSSEARYASIARSMADGQSPLLVPHWYGEPHITKPPGFYWLVALSIRTLGDHPWAIRLPSTLCGVGVLIVLRHLAGKLYGPRRARLAVAFAAVSPLFLASHRAATTDGALHLCMTLTLAAIAMAACERRSGWWLLAGAAAGVGAMMKGPIAWLPLAFGVLWLLQSRHRGRRPSGFTIIGSVLLAVVPLLAWTLYVTSHVSESGSVWWQQIAGRFGDGADHPRPWWFIWPVALIGLFPATAWLCPPLGWRTTANLHLMLGGKQEPGHLPEGPSAAFARRVLVGPIASSSSAW